jgi:hypothetical protein
MGRSSALKLHFPHGQPYAALAFPAGPKVASNHPTVWVVLSGIRHCDKKVGERTPRDRDTTLGQLSTWLLDRRRIAASA